MGREDAAPAFWKTAVAGQAGGMLGMSISYPFDTVRIRLQTDPAIRGQSMVAAAKWITRLDGPMALFRGLFVPVMGYGETRYARSPSPDSLTCITRTPSPSPSPPPPPVRLHQRGGLLHQLWLASFLQESKRHRCRGRWRAHLCWRERRWRVGPGASADRAGEGEPSKGRLSSTTPPPDTTQHPPTHATPTQHRPNTDPTPTQHPPIVSDPDGDADRGNEHG